MSTKFFENIGSFVRYLFDVSIILIYAHVERSSVLTLKLSPQINIVNL